MIFAIANTKGGVGKSTLSMNLTHALQLTFPSKRVLLLDGDPQLSCVEWGQYRAESELQPFIDVQPIKSDGMRAILEERLKQYDFIVIDVGGADNPNLRRTMIHANVVLIPSSLSTAEHKPTANMVDIIKEAMNEFNPKLQAFGVLNKIKPTKERQFIDAFKETFPDFVQWIDGYIPDLIAFSRVYGQGKTVFDLVDKEEDAKAKGAIVALTHQVLDQLGVKHE